MLSVVDGTAAFVVSIANPSANIYTLKYIAWCLPLIFACTLIGVGVLVFTRRLGRSRLNRLSTVIALALPVFPLVIGRCFPGIFVSGYVIPGMLFLVPVVQVVLIDWGPIKRRHYGVAVVDLVAFLLCSQIGRYYYLALV